MKKLIEFELKIKPKAKERHRHAARVFRDKQTNELRAISRTYNSASHHAFATTIRNMIAKELHLRGFIRPSERPILVDIVAEFTPALSWSKKKKASAISGELQHTSKPDIDNLTKMVFDEMNGLVWKDDAQVFSCSSTKRYGEVDRWLVTVYEYIHYDEER